MSIAPFWAMHTLRLVSALLAVAGSTVTAALPAHAVPRPGESLPAFSAHDLNGVSHSAREYAGRRTLLIAITDRGAGEAMRAWFDAADTRAPSGVARESIISLRLPFFVSSGMARGKAREEVPRTYWDDTLLDARGDLAARLGLARSTTPYVFVLDESGRVVASVHAPVNSQAAERVWNALRAGR